MPIAQTFGLVTNSQTVAEEMAPTLIGVPPTNYTFVTADLTGGIQVSGALTVSDGREIAFYVMNQGNFSEWRQGHPSVIMLAKPYFISGNFTFTPGATGTYFFVFDNQDSSRRSVIISLNVVQSQSQLAPIVAFSGYEGLAIGLVLLVLGVKTGKRKQQTSEPKPDYSSKWTCRFCGTSNSLDLVFCSKCDRSRS